MNKFKWGPTFFKINAFLNINLVKYLKSMIHAKQFQI